MTIKYYKCMKKDSKVALFELPVPTKVFLIGREITPVNGEPYLQFQACYQSLEVAKDVLLHLDFSARIVEYQYVDLSKL